MERIVRRRTALGQCRSVPYLALAVASLIDLKQAKALLEQLGRAAIRPVTLR